MPAAISPGSTISGSVAPPKPAASITRIAATTGEPKIAETAAKAPAAPRTTSNCGGASFFARFTENTARPPPSAISGASGPRTSPRPIVAIAASTTPGSMFGAVAPIWSPYAGMWPPLPGRRAMANATGKPARKSTGSGHHQGTLLNPRSPGRSVNTPIWIWLINSRNAHDASDTTTPITAAKARITTKLRLRISAAGSGGAGGAGSGGAGSGGVGGVAGTSANWDHLRARARTRPTVPGAAPYGNLPTVHRLPLIHWGGLESVVAPVFLDLVIARAANVLG